MSASVVALGLGTTHSTHSTCTGTDTLSRLHPAQVHVHKPSAIHALWEESHLGIASEQAATGLSHGTADKRDEFALHTTNVNGGLAFKLNLARHQCDHKPAPATQTTAHAKPTVWHTYPPRLPQLLTAATGKLCLRGAVDFGS